MPLTQTYHAAYVGDAHEPARASPRDVERCADGGDLPHMMRSKPLSSTILPSPDTLL